MKIRKGFVSNSSSSSFIVRIADHSFLKTAGENFIATTEDIEKLKDFGFQPSNLISPFDTRDTTAISGENPKHLSMKYYVVCNQDEVIYFLVKNNIPFKASVHYDQTYISYQKDSDHIFKAPNFGQSLCMYGEDLYDDEDIELIMDTAPFRKFPKDEWIENNKWWEDEEE